MKSSHLVSGCLCIALCIAFVASSLVAEAKSKPKVDPCDQNLDNCVVWVKTCKNLKWMPSGLCTLEQKKARIAEHDIHAAQPGYVAVMDLGYSDRINDKCQYNKKFPKVPIGHVGLITNVANGLVTLEDTNYDGHGHKRTITSTPEQLRIIGYICDWGNNN